VLDLVVVDRPDGLGVGDRREAEGEPGRGLHGGGG
jgi:hypothetical protein